METQEKNKFIKLIIIIIATFISILIIIAGMLYYNYEYNKIKTEKYEQLRTISQLKISQLSLWNDRNIAVATVNSKSPFLFNEIENWLLSQKDVESKNKIIERLKLSATYHHYENIIISSPNGIPLLSIKQNFNAFDSIPKTAIKEAAKTQDIKFTYFYESTLDSNAIYYDVMSPLVNSQDETIAVLVFRIDPNYYIFPRLQSWPIPTKTAEIQIVRKIDDNVIIINELKNIKNSAFQINIPLANKNFPAVQAVNGREGIYEGKDYRGQKVLTDMRPIPETPFYIITKVDTYEVFSEIYYREYIIIIISILIIIITGLSSYIIYGFYKKN